MCFGKKGAWAFVPAILISLSRVFLCVHYPTDVLGGIVEGVILGVAVVVVGRIILNKLESWWLSKKIKKEDVSINNQQNDKVPEIINEEKDN
jgi:membrane-associated phospholipid phosphatase